MDISKKLNLLEVPSPFPVRHGVVERLLLEPGVMHEIHDHPRTPRGPGRRPRTDPWHPAGWPATAAASSPRRHSPRTRRRNRALPRIPARPATSIAANARYGFASAPGMRFSIRNDFSCPTIGTRLSGCRAPRPFASAPSSGLEPFVAVDGGGKPEAELGRVLDQPAEELPKETGAAGRPCVPE